MTDPSVLTSWRAGVWRFRVTEPVAASPGPRVASASVIAGVADRSCDFDALRRSLEFADGLVQAEQVHGASIASIGRIERPVMTIPGCDGLATRLPGLALVIRTADCLPILAWDPIRRALAIIHAGWRGLAASLPIRMVSFMRQVYGTQPEELWVGIGPAIRACCYEVGPEFARRFEPFLRVVDGRRMCDLAACAASQLAEAGVRTIQDSRECTACHLARWYSYRREGDQGGRLLSFVVME